MVQSLRLQSQQSRGDFHHVVHLRIILPIFFFSFILSLVATHQNLIIFLRHFFSDRLLQGSFDLCGKLHLSNVLNWTTNTGLVCT